MPHPGSAADGHYMSPFCPLASSLRIHNHVDIKKQDFQIRHQHQHTGTFTASPPRDVSLYTLDIASPVSFMVRITVSRDTI